MVDIEKFYNILKEEKEEIISEKWCNFDNEEYLIIVTEQQKKDYINIYVLNYKYRIDNINCLYQQDEYQYKDEYKKDKKLEEVAFYFYLWDKYGDEEEE